MRRILPLLLLVLIAAALAPGAGTRGSAQTQHRIVIPLVARDQDVKPVPPPPGPGYCAPVPGSGIPSPPNAVFGLLTIGGSPAPAGTLVALSFDGNPGPYAYTQEAGGYRVLYAAGGQGHEPPCINQVGSIVGLIVNGQSVSSGVPVGPEPGAGIALLFNVAIP